MNEYDLMSACDLLQEDFDGPDYAEGWPQRYTVGLKDGRFVLLDTLRHGAAVPFTETNYLTQVCERCTAYNDAWVGWMSSL